MKIAIPIWQGRVSPVFDVAGQLLLVDWTDNREISRGDRLFEEVAVEDRVKTLEESGVKLLICAGISQVLEAGLVERGVEVIAGICGDVEEVLAAYGEGKLGEARFAMPGCCCQKRRRQRGRCRRRQ
jgi:predicted Fe-Mo cluster-binding NifX family protein